MNNHERNDRAPARCRAAQRTAVLLLAVAVPLLPTTAAHAYPRHLLDNTSVALPADLDTTDECDVNNGRFWSYGYQRGRQRLPGGLDVTDEGGGVAAEVELEAVGDCAELTATVVITARGTYGTSVSRKTARAHYDESAERWRIGFDDLVESLGAISIRFDTNLPTDTNRIAVCHEDHWVIHTPLHPSTYVATTACTDAST